MRATGNFLLSGASTTASMSFTVFVFWAIAAVFNTEPLPMHWRTAALLLMLAALWALLGLAVFGLSVLWKRAHQ